MLKRGSASRWKGVLLRLRSAVPGRRPRAGAAAGEKPVLEIQYHPSDIRRGVWYLFLSRRRLTQIVTVLALYLVFLGFSMVVTPAAVRARLSESRYQGLLDERAQLGERLQPLVERLAVLEESADEARLEMAKIYLAYGFDYHESIGQGGYPFAAAPTPGDSIYQTTVRRGNALEARAGEQLAVIGSFLEEVQAFEDEHQERVRTTPSITPLRGEDFVLTSPFGNRRSPFTEMMEFHAGIDLAAPTGLPVYATADGVVAFAGLYPKQRSVGWWRYGNLVVIDHDENFTTLYAHCDEVLDLRRGQRVTKGQQVATVGSSGWSTNPHLHYEVRRRGDDGELRPVDPRIYILDHRWRDEERLLARSRLAPNADEYEPLPRLARR